MSRTWPSSCRTCTTIGQLGKMHFAYFDMEFDGSIVMLHHEADHNCILIVVLGARTAWVSGAKPDNVHMMGRP